MRPESPQSLLEQNKKRKGLSISALDDEWTLTARWIVPVDGPPVEQGTVTIAGERIVSLQREGERRADLDLGNAAILPGLVNAHTHLDLTGLRGRCNPEPDFTQWLRKVIRHRRSLSEDQVLADIQVGLEESLTHGVTLVGDISYQGLSWNILTQAPLWSVLFFEILGLPIERAQDAWKAFQTWRNQRKNPPDRCFPGLSPHAPYSIHTWLFEKAAQECATEKIPVAIHLAETQAELELLQHRCGPLVDFLKEMEVWQPGGLAQSSSQVIQIFGGLENVLWVHGNYLESVQEIPASQTIVYCPRTHAAFGHRPHPVRELLARGIRVALGTDSLASSPDLDILAEARFVHQIYPEIPGPHLLRMITLNGAEALGFGPITGSLTPGKSADLVVLPLPNQDSPDPFSLILESTLSVGKVMWRGQCTAVA